MLRLYAAVLAIQNWEDCERTTLNMDRSYQGWLVMQEKQAYTAAAGNPDPSVTAARPGGSSSDPSGGAADSGGGCTRKKCILKQAAQDVVEIASVRQGVCTLGQGGL